MDDDPLLRPFRLRHLELRNRVFSSAHEPAYSEHGMPTERYTVYHAEKAKGGVALTMTAGTAVVSPDSPPAFGNLHAYDDAIVPSIRRLTDAIHQHGAAAMIQISHLGRRTGWGQDDWLPVVAPSALREPAHRSHPKVAEPWDIERIVGHYADAAERMIAGGMDGVEVEGYGHLFDQFLSPATNHRDDDYGGSFDGRLRFPLEVMRGIRSRLGPEVIVGVRMVVDETIPDGFDMPVGLAVLDRFASEGLIDFVNVIRGHIEHDVGLTAVIPIHGMAAAPHLAFAGRVREAMAAHGVAVFHASKIDDVATARHAIAEGLLDMVGMTRAQIAEPHLVRKLAAGQERRIRPCVGATYCLDRIYQAGEALCIHNAATGRELHLPHDIPPAQVRRRVLVIGGGPAGLEAARVAAERGHAVELWEAASVLGGQVRLAARNPRRRDLMGIVQWRTDELARLGVVVHIDRFAEPVDVLAAVDGDGFDAVIVATGGWQQVPRLEHGDELMVGSWDVIGGQVSPTGDVLVYDDDGTHSAMTAVELTAARVVSGEVHSVELVTPERTVGVDVGGMNLVPYARAMNEADVRISLNQRVRSIAAIDGRLEVEIGSDHSPVRHRRTVDLVVGDHGVLPNDELYLALVPNSRNGGEVDHHALLGGLPQRVVRHPESTFDLYRIGDAVSGRNLHAAIYDALRLCVAL